MVGLQDRVRTPSVFLVCIVLGQVSTLCRNMSDTRDIVAAKTAEMDVAGVDGTTRGLESAMLLMKREFSLPEVPIADRNSMGVSL